MRAKINADFEIWTIDNDGRDSRVKSDRINIVKVTVRDEFGRFAGRCDDL